MHGNLSAANGTAIIPAVRSASEKSIAVRPDSEQPDTGNDWFSVPARALLGSDPGLALHVLTGISESSGYRYAGGDRPVPGYIVRQLLRGPQGEQWLRAIMDGCTEHWWIEFQKHERMGRAADSVRG